MSYNCLSDLCPVNKVEVTKKYVSKILHKSYSSRRVINSVSQPASGRRTFCSSLVFSNKKGRWFCELFFDSQIRYASESEFKYPYDSNQNVVIL